MLIKNLKSVTLISKTESDQITRYSFWNNFSKKGLIKRGSMSITSKYYLESNILYKITKYKN